MVAIDIQEWSTTEMEEEVREEEEEEISVFEYEQEDQEEQNHKVNDERETDNKIDTTKWDEYYLLSIEMKPRITEEETNEEEDEEENNNEEQAIKTFKHEDHEQQEIKEEQVKKEEQDKQRRHTNMKKYKSLNGHYTILTLTQWKTMICSQTLSLGTQNRRTRGDPVGHRRRV